MCVNPLTFSSLTLGTTVCSDCYTRLSIIVEIGLGLGLE